MQLVAVVGTELGVIVGAAVDDKLGIPLGLALGNDVGTQLGVIVGSAVGDKLDTVLADALGNDVDTELGVIVGAAVGDILGIPLGDTLSIALGVELDTVLGVKLGVAPAELGIADFIARVTGACVGNGDGSLVEGFSDRNVVGQAVV